MTEQSFERLEERLKSDLPERVEFKVQRERRRRWTAEDKVRIVREMLEPGAVALRVAERHEISTGLLFTWRRQLMADVPSGFVPVQVSAPPEAPSPSPSFGVASLPSGVIEIELPGGVRVRAANGVEPKLLRGVLTALVGR
jgi:transposase